MKPSDIAERRTDVLIIGAGLAGLYAALSLDSSLRCDVVTKEDVSTSNSWMAQGGIAAALLPDDQPHFHYEDTLIAGAGLCDPSAVRVLVEEGPAEIERLRRMNVPFDLNDEGELHITREGGHTRSRVVHAGGDATGRETVKVLSQIAASRDNISMYSNLFLVDLLTDISTGACLGALFCDHDGELLAVYASGIILATGGIGQIYRRTTNPAVATGDGVAAAIRVGADVTGMEFIQFHPTALYVPDSDNAFLISEALRGEGATLINREGERFILGVHPQAELAPRDIVARTIFREMQRSGQPCVYLDISAQPRDALLSRFPNIFSECMKHGIDIAKQPIPVCPAQHYLMGGVAVDLHAQSGIARLYACGETACSGVHGANRLASNSMLECLVFGRRAAEHIGGLSSHAGGEVDWPPVAQGSGQTDVAAVREELRDLCQQYAGAIRTREGLLTGLNALEELERKMSGCMPRKAEWETINMLAVARSVFEACLTRHESIGAHTISI